ncbi:MAG: divalent metal cation transporter, partial [Gammaproteobacteria bacterium]|nr:divalent metal cation transporter [Gammaproteobacteria bacterium]
EPLLGSAAKYFFAAGLFAAGLTSAITAPLAAAFALSGVLGWDADLKAPRVRAIWAAVLLFGALAAFFGGSPVQAIVIAQAANGVLLPLVAMFLLYAVNRTDLMGSYRNGLAINLAGGAVVLLTALLGANQLWKVVTRFVG